MHYNSTSALKHYTTSALQQCSTKVCTAILQDYSSTALQHYSTEALQYSSTVIYSKKDNGKTSYAVIVIRHVHDLEVDLRVLQLLEHEDVALLEDRVPAQNDLGLNEVQVLDVHQDRDFRNVRIDRPGLDRVQEDGQDSRESWTVSGVFDVVGNSEKADLEADLALGLPGPVG